MASRLVNVRLDSERLRKARELRESGVTLSDVVRDAIDESFLRLRPAKRGDARAMIQTLLEQYPDPADLPPRDYDVHDRASARQAIIRKLRPA